jgi:hypothetical protein
MPRAKTKGFKGIIEEKTASANFCPIPLRDPDYTKKWFFGNN